MAREERLSPASGATDSPARQGAAEAGGGAGRARGDAVHGAGGRPEESRPAGRNRPKARRGWWVGTGSHQWAASFGSIAVCHLLRRRPLARVLARRPPLLPLLRRRWRRGSLGRRSAGCVGKIDDGCEHSGFLPWKRCLLRQVAARQPVHLQCAVLRPNGHLGGGWQHTRHTKRRGAALWRRTVLPAEFDCTSARLFFLFFFFFFSLYLLLL